MLHVVNSDTKPKRLPISMPSSLSDVRPSLFAPQLLFQLSLSLLGLFPFSAMRLGDASFDRTDFAGEAGMDKVPVNHNNGADTTTGPNEVIVCTGRVGCDRLDEWRSGACSLKCQNETAEITLLNTVDTTIKHNKVSA